MYTLDTGKASSVVSFGVEHHVQCTIQNGLQLLCYVYLSFIYQSRQKYILTKATERKNKFKPRTSIYLNCINTSVQCGTNNADSDAEV